MKPFSAMTETRYGPMIAFIHDRWIGRSITTYGEYSESEVGMFRRFVKPGDVVVDAGANIGAHTVPLAQIVGEEGHVHAFEPQGMSFMMLCGNIALNSLTNVTPYLCGLSNLPGRMMAPAFDPTQEDFASGIALDLHEGPEVEIITLDMLSLERVDFLKADVEGMEHSLLAGARETIQRDLPILYLENDRGREESERLLNLLETMGYKAYWHFAPLYNPDNYFGARKDIFPNISSWMLVCIPEEKPQPEDLAPARSIRLRAWEPCAMAHKEQR